MTPPRTVPGLPTVFAIFLGLMITAFIGVGVNTFYPSPATPYERQMEDIGRQEREIEGGRPASELSPADRGRLQTLRDSVTVLSQRARDARDGWGRTTSIILIAFATLVMAIAVLRADQLAVLSSGLLLGGVFTMCYGVGMILATTTSVARFVVLTIALVITIGLGYLRFARRSVSVAPLARGADLTVSPTHLVDLTVRVEGIERRLDAVGRALASSHPSNGPTSGPSNGATPHP